MPSSRDHAHPVFTKSTINLGPKSPNLVLMTYSTTSNVLTAVLSEWKGIDTKVTPANIESSETYSAAHMQTFSKEEAEQLPS